MHIAVMTIWPSNGLSAPIEQKDPFLITMIGEPLFDGLADDPRFKAFLRKMKLPEWPNQTTAART